MRHFRRIALGAVLFAVSLMVGIYLYAWVFRIRAEHLLALLKTFQVEQTPATEVLKLRSKSKREFETRQTLLVLLLVVFLGIGVTHVFKPDWFVKRSGVRRGGEMLTEYNRTGFQIAGAIFAAFAVYMLYSLFRR